MVWQAISKYWLWGGFPDAGIKNESVWIGTHTVDRDVHPAPQCRFTEDCRMDRVKFPVHRHVCFDTPCPHCGRVGMDITHYFFHCSHTAPVRAGLVGRLQVLATLRYVPQCMQVALEVMSNTRRRSRSLKESVLRVLTGCMAAVDSEGKDLDKADMELWADVCLQCMSNMQSKWIGTARKLHTARKAAEAENQSSTATGTSRRRRGRMRRWMVYTAQRPT